MNIRDIFKGRIHVVAIILFVAVIVTIVFAISSAPEPLNVAVAVLTVLIAFVAIYMGLNTWMSKRDWDAFEKKIKEELDKVRADWDNFEKEQKKTIEDTNERLGIIKGDTDELNWLDNLCKSMRDDPHLESENAKGTIGDIKEHYFKRDQYNEAWKYYGIARWYEKEEQYDDAIKYYEKADKVELEEDNDKSKELRMHIWQSLGIDHYLRGQQRGAIGEKEDAIKDYNNAIKYYVEVIKNDPQFVEAFDNKGNTYIELAKISSDNKQKQLIDNAIKCFDDAIEKKVERARHWWATFHFDKARALALRADKDKREDLDKVAKELEETLDMFVAKPVGFFDVPDQFQDFNKVKHDNEIKRLLDLLRGVIRQAMQKGD